MDYLDDLYLFKQVVDCNGISSASRHLASQNPPFPGESMPWNHVWAAVPP
jgi:hypothetical protein